jgi:hypothetical protein
MAKLEKNDQVGHNMTKIASVMAVTTVFIGLWTLISAREGGGPIHETKLPM